MPNVVNSFIVIRFVFSFSCTGRKSEIINVKGETKTSYGKTLYEPHGHQIHQIHDVCVGLWRISKICL